MKDIKNDPAFVEGMEAFLMGDWSAAKDSFMQLEKHFPENDHVIFILGNIYYSLGVLDKSIEYYKKTIEISDGDVCGNAYYKIGVSYFKMGKFTEALQAFKQSIQAEKSQHVMVYYYLGLISTHLGNDEQAIKYFDKLRLASPQTKMAIFIEAQLKVKRHEFETAIELLLQFLEVSPEFAEAHHLLGAAYMGLYQNMKALRCFRKAVELNPADKRSAMEISRLSTTDWP
ncbi:MAG: tetratricopeptide repeat protein [Spirochaetales bacterium]|nr:tetratricopeptide repeat protein [Spirochaetales bacterium]